MFFLCFHPCGIISGRGEPVCCDERQHGERVHGDYLCVQPAEIKSVYANEL